METFDVIIVGAGPAGLKCAETLGNSKFKVLLLEKNKEIGPKICAGALNRKNIKYLNLPSSLFDFQYNKIKLHIKNNHSIVQDDDNLIYSVDRKNLGQWQLKKINKFNNIEVRTGSKVSKIEKDYIVVDGKKILYKFLVGADGSSSIVRRYLNIKSEEIGIAIQYIIPIDIYKEFELFLDSELFCAWYAWIVPHKNYVSIGCGCNPKILSSKELMINFQSWLYENKVDISKGKYEAFILNYDYQGYKFGNIFLAGDAGGFISGLTGEGIYTALISGEEIGRIILNPNYTACKIMDLLKEKKKHAKLTNVLIKSGKFRVIIFYVLMQLLKILYFKKKIIRLMF